MQSSTRDALEYPNILQACHDDSIAALKGFVQEHEMVDEDISCIAEIILNRYLHAPLIYSVHTCFGIWPC